MARRFFTFSTKFNRSPAIQFYDLEFLRSSHEHFRILSLPWYGKLIHQLTVKAFCYFLFFRHNTYLTGQILTPIQININTKVGRRIRSSQPPLLGRDRTTA